MLRSRGKEGMDMPDLSTRTFGRRTFVRLGVAAGGLGMLAACAPAAPPPPAATAPPAAPAPPKPTDAPKPAAATAAPAPAATQPAAAATTKPAAAASGQVTTLKLLGWNYEPPLVQENLDRFVQQNPSGLAIVISHDGAVSIAANRDGEVVSWQQSVSR